MKTSTARKSSGTVPPAPERTALSGRGSAAASLGAPGAPELSRRAKWLLVLFGSLFGIGLGVVVGYAFKRQVHEPLPDGSSFENLSDLRHALSERDARDLKPDNSVSLRSLMVTDESDQIIYRLAPNLRVTFQGVPVRTSSAGLRGPERPVEKPAGVYRIALLGDSFAFGWGVDEDKIFATRLEELLNAAGGIDEKKVEVLNFGVPGYSTFQEAALFQQYALPFQPDAALVFFVENDFGLPFFIKSFGSVSNDMITNDNFSRNAGDTDPQLQKKRNELVALLDANQALRRLAEKCRELGIPLFLAINPGKSAPRMSEKLTVLRDVPEIRHLWLRDDMLARIEKDKINPRTLTLKKDPHPSALKHQLLAEFLAEKMKAFPDMR